MPSAYFISDVGGCIRLNDGNEAVVAPEHEFATEFTVDKAATCTEAGSKSKHCLHCSAVTEATEIPALGHTLTHVAQTPATKEAEGNLEYWSCENCDKIFSDAEGKTEITDRASVVIPKLENKSSAGIILGSVFGVLAAAGIIILIIFFVKKKDDGNKKTQVTEDTQSDEDEKE